MPPATRSQPGTPVAQASLEAAAPAAVTPEVIEPTWPSGGSAVALAARPDPAMAAPVRRIDPRQGRAATAHKPAPLPVTVEEPVFAGAGRWSELPLPGEAGPPAARASRPSAAPVEGQGAAPRVRLEPTSDGLRGGEMAAWFERGMELVRRDPVVVFIVIASALALGLAGILFSIS